VTGSGAVSTVSEALRRLQADESNEEAWTVIFERLWPFAYATAFRLLGGDQAATEDVTQTVFFRLVRGDIFNRVPDEDRFRSYLAVMTRHAAADHLRAKLRRPFGEQVALPDTLIDPAPSPDELLERDERFETLARYLQPEDRRLLELVVQGYSGVEIARELAIEPTAARVRLLRLRRSLASRLE
jgi:RNA polymerase sigma factor (sigma-70 family)